MKLQEEDLVLVTVDRITPTVVFVKLPDGKEATIITSEIAPGRIKNIRAYVVPNKKIVCKVLKIQGDHIALSLRRVTSKEKKEVLEKTKQEQTINSAFKQLLKQDYEKIKPNLIKEFGSLFEFALNAKKNKELLEKHIPKKYHEQIEKVINKKQKQIEIKKIVKLKCLESDGLLRIKKVMEIKSLGESIRYLAAGKFQITLKADDYKQANKKMDEILENIESSAKENKCEFSVNESKK